MRVAIVALAVAGHMACVPGPAIAKEPSDVEARHARAFITAFQVWSDKAQVQHGAFCLRTIVSDFEMPVGRRS